MGKSPTNDWVFGGDFDGDVAFEGTPEEVLEWLKIMESDLDELLVRVATSETIIPAREYLAKATSSS